MEKQTSQRDRTTPIVLAVTAISAMMALGLLNYLLFHAIAEIFAIVVAGGIFMLVWNSRKFFNDNYFFFLGLVFPFVAVLDLLHTLSYKGMGVFDHGTNLATQFWIAARYMHSASFLIAPLLLKRTIRPRPTLLLLTLATMLVTVTIFPLAIFPVCYREGSGLTAFKLASEAVICLGFAGGIALLYPIRQHFDRRVLRYVVMALVFAILAELAFTLYHDVYDAFNMVGHLLKVISFYCVYRAIIDIGLKRPYSLLFRELQQRQDELQDTGRQLEETVKIRTAALQRANEDLKTYAETLREQADLLDLAYDTIMVLDLDGRILFWNWGAENSYGWSREEVLGKEAHTLRRTRFPESMEAIRKQLLTNGHWEGVVTHTTRDNRKIRAATRWALRKGPSGDPSAILEIGNDITAKEEAETYVRQQKEVLQKIVDNIPVILCFYRPDGRVMMVNKAFEKTVGWSTEEVQNLDIMEACYPDPDYRREVWEFMMGAEVCWRDFKLRVRRGDCLETSWANVKLSDGSQIGIGIDITERKHAEEALQEHQEELRALAHELAVVEERERRQLATGLHDHVSQSLALCKFRLSAALAAAGEDRVKTSLQQVQTTLDEVIEKTRSLSFEISPPILYELGLTAGLEWLADWFQERYHVSVTCDARDNLRQVEESLSVLLFRAARELLCNAGKHARPKQVSIRGRCEDGDVHIEVADDGIGFDPEAVKPHRTKAQTFGLLSIRERMRHIGGNMTIDSNAGQGTTVALSAPLRTID